MPSDAQELVGSAVTFDRAWSFDAKATYRQLVELLEPLTAHPLARVDGAEGERLVGSVDAVARAAVGDMLAYGVEDPSYGAPHVWGRTTAKDGAPQFLLGSVEAEISSIMSAVLAARTMAFRVQAVLEADGSTESAEAQLAAALHVGEPIATSRGLAGVLASGKSPGPDRREEHLLRWQEWRAQVTRPSEKRRGRRSPTQPPLACEICGARPARRVVARRHVSIIVVARFMKTDVVCCRSHARKILVPALRKSLWQGWWGTGLFGPNEFVIVADIAWLLRTLVMRAADPGATGTSAYIQRELRMLGLDIVNLVTRHRTVVFVEGDARP